MPQATEFDVNQWESGANHHAQGEDFDVNKYQGASASATPPPATSTQVVKDATSVGGMVGKRIIENVKGLPAAFNPVPQTTAEKVGVVAGLPAPITRMVGGVLSALGGATQVPAAIHDINASPDPTRRYQEAAAGTAGDMLTQAALMKAPGAVGDVVEKVKGVDPQALRTATKQTAGAVASDVVNKVPGVKELRKFGDRYDAAKKPVVTDPTEIKSRLDEILSPKEKAPAPAEAPKTAPEPKVAPTPKGEASYVHEAVKQAGPDATVEEVTKKAKELRTQGDQFEETFGQPLSNYKNPDGSFNMRDFIHEVVKPGTAPPEHVISRVFGSDGVKLVQDVSGKPIEKWAQAKTPYTASEQAAKARQSVSGGSASADPIADIKSLPVMSQVTGEVPASGFLKKVGADEGSVMKGVGRTPEEHASSVDFHRGQYKAGNMEPVELHVDENNNPIGADGRHRAVAAIKEGGPKATVKIHVIKHAFQSVTH